MINQNERINESEIRPAPNRRQQDKIIGVIEDGINFSEPSHSLKGGQRKGFLEKLSSGEIDENRVKREISRIRTNAYKITDETLETSEQSDQLKGMVWILFEGERYDPKRFAQGRQSVGEHEIKRIMEMYPNPWDMNEALDPVIKRIGDRNGEKKREEYKNSREELLNKLYGKRYEYWVQFEHLKEESKQEIALRKEEDLGTVTEANVSDVRGGMRQRGYIPFTVQLEDGRYNVFSLDEGTVPRNLDDPESHAKMRRLTALMAQRVAENDPDFEKRNLKAKILRFHKAVAPDYNDAMEISFGNRTPQQQREYEIRSNMLRIFNSEVEMS